MLLSVMLLTCFQFTSFIVKCSTRSFLSSFFCLVHTVKLFSNMLLVSNSKYQFPTTTTHSQHLKLSLCYFKYAVSMFCTSSHFFYILHSMICGCVYITMMIFILVCKQSIFCTKQSFGIIKVYLMAYQQESSLINVTALCYSPQLFCQSFKLAGHNRTIKCLF